MNIKIKRDCIFTRQNISHQENQLSYSDCKCYQPEISADRQDLFLPMLLSTTEYTKLTEIE